MKIKLINAPDKKLKATEQILVNRGIDLKNAYHYLNTTDADINSPLAFGADKMELAATAVMKCVTLGKRMLVVVDCDCDGYTSAAIFINYLHDLFPYYVENNLDWFLHSGKQHGLSDLELDKHSEYGLIVVPDAASNDYDLHLEYAYKELPILVLDHHEADFESPNAIVINNQLCDYPNKFLSGAGVTWQFCRFLDFILESNYADRYLDLVALGNTADMMSLRELETKHLITKGFKDENIHNPFIRGMADKNAFTLGPKITSMGAAFYIAPFVNAMVRSGELEEKEILFQSMLNFKAFQKIPSNKRGHKPGEMEMLVTQALRTATNVKNRQSRVEEETIEKLEGLIEKRNLLEHKVLVFLLEPGQVDRNVAGLIANKFMAKYQRPVCMLTKVTDENGISYQGSARGCDLAGITEFKVMCEATGVIDYAQGHQGAFGLGIPADKIEEFLAITDEMLKDMSDEPIYYVDYLYDGYDVSGQDILDIAYMDELWGQNMPEPYVAFEKLKIKKDMVTVYRKKDNTLKITLPNRISLIMFHAEDELCDKLQNRNPGYYIMNIVARCAANEYNGNVSPQLKIKDFEIVGQGMYDF
jgi:single-stranded-DNA-specific exonuclease